MTRPRRQRTKRPFQVTIQAQQVFIFMQLGTQQQFFSEPHEHLFLEVS